MSRAQETTILPGLEMLAANLSDNGKNLNQQAVEIGLNRSHYHNLVNRRKGASLAVARDIARYFNTSIENLLETHAEKILV